MCSLLNLTLPSVLIFSNFQSHESTSGYYLLHGNSFSYGGVALYENELYKNVKE